MAIQNMNIPQIPEQSLALYVDAIIENALLAYQVVALRHQIDDALDEGNKSRFMELSQQLNEMLSAS